MSSTTKPPNRWNKQEDLILRDAVAAQNREDINWQQVAERLPDRSNKDCRKRWVYTLATDLKKGRWSDDEDTRLTTAVAKYGARWAMVAQEVGSRQADQCSRRWHQTANPHISRERWSLEEDEQLRVAVALHGNRWTEIVERYFYNRTPIAAKNRYIQRYGELSPDAMIMQPLEEKDTPVIPVFDYGVIAQPAMCAVSWY